MTAERPLRVLHYNHTSTVSGAEISLLTLAEALAPEHVAIVAAPEGDLLERARAAGLPVIACRGTSGSLALHPWRTSLAMVDMLRAGVELARAARTHRADVVHANSPRSGLIATVARCLGGPPFVVHVRDAAPAGPVSRTVYRVLASTSSRLVAISHFVAGELATQVPSRARVAMVYNPVRADVFRPDPIDAGAWRAANDIPAGAPLFAVIGQITSWKRQRFAIDVLGAIRNGGVDARLVVVGDVKFDSADTRLDNPSYWRSVQARADEADVRGAVHLLGERHDVPSILRAADVLLAPAEAEPFGRAVAEAMTSGTAIVAPRTPGGPAELVRDGLDGALVAPNDLAAWAAASWKLSVSPVPGPEGRERAQALFSVPAHAARMVELFQAARRG